MLESLLEGAISGIIKGAVSGAQIAGMTEAEATAKAAAVLRSEAARLDLVLAQMDSARSKADAGIAAAAPKAV
jgi:hypothetical protein